ncbi:response regulator [Leifsonia sp. AG29]|uniref:response regulator n=1 Tax=Leifsonia sp. AG29 TaxID=2598860 RepID=UPI00131E3351|nr:response regulator [Leifsonia sp. AG29]
MPSASSPPSVLIVDDDPLIRAVLQAALEAHGHRSAAVADPDEPHGLADPDAVVLDATLPGRSLSESLDLLAHRDDGTPRPILVVSGALTPPAELAGTGVRYLAKPIPLAEFVAAVGALTGSGSRDGPREAGYRGI